MLKQICLAKHMFWAHHFEIGRHWKVVRQNNAVFGKVGKSDELYRQKRHCHKSFKVHDHFGFVGIPCLLNQIESLVVRLVFFVRSTQMSCA